MNKYVKWIILLIIIICIIMIIYLKYKQIYSGLNCNNQIESGEIIKISDQLFLARPDYGNIREDMLKNQEAVKALKDKIDMIIEYNAQLKEQISKGGGTVITSPSGDVTIDFSGKTDAGTYEGSAGTVDGGWHKLNQTFNPIPLQVYINKKGEVAIGTTADWVDITIDKVQKEPSSWWQNLWLGCSAGMMNYDGKNKILGGLMGGYKNYGIEIGSMPSGVYAKAILKFDFR